jgi:hypothetical protein
MNVSLPARSGAMCREEKEAMLCAFMSEDLQTPRDMQADRNWTVLARNTDSPVVRALAKAACAPEFSGVSCRVIVLDNDGPAADLSGPAIADVEGADLRILKDHRFMAAHEQLVIGAAKVWIGDCMRRDPVKRDAFEMYHAGNVVAARHAELSFERLWSIAKPIGNALVPRLVAASAWSNISEARPATRR